MEKRAVFSHVVKSDARSCWDVKDVSSCAILMRNWNEANYTLRKSCIVYFISF